VSHRVSLKDIVTEYQGAEPDSAKIERSTRVVRYAEDGRTPLVIEHEYDDEEGTRWITQRNLETGEMRIRHVPEDR
jgi:hypothetical protein